MKIELHILQNFAPSNLNRDDTGAPKDCELGGYRRGRISSQCMKRAIRDTFHLHGMFDSNELAVRTKRLVENVVSDLVTNHGREAEGAAAIVSTALAGAGLNVKSESEDYKSEYLMFLPKRHVSALADLVQRHWGAIAPLAGGPTNETSGESGAKGKTRKREKAERKSAFPREIGNEVVALFKDADRTPELALFGRMIADDPSWNVDAACQVAHAISTNRVAMDFDFYTAVDDLRPEDTAGSDMMGTVQFNSSCFYRYSAIDVVGLRRNLGGDDPLVRKTIGAYVRASVMAIPTGKQNSMAAHNPPSLVLTMARANGAPVSLANAFCDPIRPRANADLVSASIEALCVYLERMCRMYAPPAKAYFIADRPVHPVDGVSLDDKGNLESLAAAVEALVAERGA